MKNIIYLLFAAIFTVDYLFTKVGVVGRYVTWLPELLSILAVVLIAVQVAARKPFFLPGKYLVILAFLVFHVLAGVILNSVQPGAVFTGLRTYFKYLPFFLVPAVFLVSDEDMMAQLKFLLVVGLLQLPLVIYQRFFQYAGVNSGDPVSGTMLISSILSIFLISAIAILVAFYVKKKISLVPFCVMVGILFIPTTLNETKGSVVLLPLAVMVPILLMPGKHKAKSMALPAAVLGVLLASFVVVYNMQPGRTDSGVDLTSFLSEERAKAYLFKDSEGERAGEAVGKVDSYVLAFKTLSKDVFQQMFGLGIGNVTGGFSKKLSGAYAEKYEYMEPGKTALSKIVWEMGVFGAVIIFVLCYMLFRDSVYLSRRDDLSGTLALGWAAVMVIYMIGLGYKNVLIHNVIGYPFWYLSGYIAATRCRREWLVMQPKESAVVA